MPDIDRGRALLHQLGTPARVLADLETSIAVALADGSLNPADVPEIRLYAGFVADVQAAYARRYLCRVWMIPIGGVGGERLVCEHPRDHAGEHRRGGTTWRPHEVPDVEPGPRRRSAVGDLVELCSELAALHGAARAAIAPGSRPVGGRRTVPGSRPPLDVEALALASDIEETVAALYAELCDACGFHPVQRGTSGRLRAFPYHVDALAEDHPLVHRVPAVLTARRDHARRVLGWDDQMIALGDCPSVFEPKDMLTRDGLLAGDTGCWSVDGQALADYTTGQGLPDEVRAACDAQRADDGDPVIWRRSRLYLPKDTRGGLLAADIVCRSCRYRSRPEDRADHVLARIEATKGC